MIPLVLYQGTRPWSGPRRLTELIDLPPAIRAMLGAHLPEVELLIDDLALTDDAALDRSTRRALTAAALMVMRFVRGGDDPAGFLSRWIARIDAALDDPEARPMVEVVARYLYTASETLAPADIFDAVRATPQRHPEAMMNLAEKFEQRGEVRGRTVGAQQTLTRLLELRFGPLDPGTAARIDAADMPLLDRWTERLFDASSLADLLDG